MSDPHHEPHVFPLGRKPGELLFCAAFLIFAAAVLAMMSWQTSWLPSAGLAAQPRLWPALSLGGMALFGAILWARTFRTMRTPGRWQEAAQWMRSLEFVGWYVLYVLAIPVIGYLPATILFCVLLTLRLGYRSRLALISAFAFALFVVLTFKTAFNVKIPGGALYELAPEGLRYILIRYF
ncbi:tripartite tricarboxylate transporter TctB family protein [Roseicyclus sp. F158]|uniref:Tripartite tricarboxylate transporter TctB family protein n=1 Tax=Tropicimonas omnivorans TaxID=3075590 RepID=A0ABU3DH49_9RHOB|nr:tripartite tricarboxylate transporter TctB family protein [Roseicyclus sp. F158]MDT0683045.1 tripartite tricarboxylate transporter TctB family protein [Roseicyclus sp. F158]